MENAGLCDCVMMKNEDDASSVTFVACAMNPWNVAE